MNQQHEEILTKARFMAMPNGKVIEIDGRVEAPIMLVPNREAQWLYLSDLEGRRFRVVGDVHDQFRGAGDLD